ncbi:hypothetical protein [Acidianus manzaensis]|uniref:hypothetical protein n=1 Tax=Acidianus manzaensis TaxID=282676 RepID=UPI001F1CB7D5|nr:hypothetical protein [Acidianus manzaensis]
MVPLLHYPLPNETFSNIQFNVIGSPATSVEVYTFEYALNTPIPSTIVETSYEEYVYAFEWTYNGNSYSANAYTSSSSAQIFGTIQLSYKETPLFLYEIIKQ